MSTLTMNEILRSDLKSPTTPATDDPHVRARAYLDHTRYSWVWVVKSCPYCCKQHHHYAGPRDGNPLSYTDRPVFAYCDRQIQQRVHQASGMLQYALLVDSTCLDLLESRFGEIRSSLWRHNRPSN